MRLDQEFEMAFPTSKQFEEEWVNILICLMGVSIVS